jgi:galactokinase
VTEAAALCDRLLAAGLDPSEREAKHRLLHRVLERWHADVGSPVAGGWWVPGRLEVFGTHTDYAGGRSLVAPIPRGLAFVTSARSDRVIRVIDAVGAGQDAVGSISLDQPPTRFRGWRHYVEVTAARLARNFPGSALGADIVFASDLPRAAGMSSSSALVVGIATALAHTGGLRARSEWLRAVRSPIDEAGYLACVENGRSFGQLAGDAGVGTHGGSEDHAAMLAGTAGACTAFAFVPLRHLHTIALPSAWRVVVATSGIGAHKTGTEREAFNRLASGTATLLDLWNTHGPSHDSLSSALDSSPTAAATLREIVRASSVPGWTAAALQDRLDHFTREDGRVSASLGAMSRADEAALGRLAAESQADSERLLNNQVPETSALVRLALETGAIAARSFGAGFGGSVWAIVHSTDTVRFSRQWMSAYHAAFSRIAEASMAFPSNPGPPVTRLF